MGGAASGTTSGTLGYQQNWLQGQLLTVVYKGRCPITEPNSLNDPLGGRGGAETSPPWGKGPGCQGHLCTRQPLSRKRTARVQGSRLARVKRS